MKILFFIMALLFGVALSSCKNVVDGSIVNNDRSTTQNIVQNNEEPEVQPPSLDGYILCDSYDDLDVYSDGEVTVLVTKENGKAVKYVLIKLDGSTVTYSFENNKWVVR